MRQVLSLSLPATDVRQIKNLAKKRGYSSASSYIRHLLKEDKDIISESELLTIVRQARKEYKKGKAIKAASIADLI